MQFRWTVVTLLAVGFAGKAQAQGTTMYAEYSVSRFHNLSSDTYLNGGTVGICIDLYHQKHFQLDVDMQGRFLAGSGRAYDAGSVGPRIGVPMGFLHLVPYGEFLIGYGRFSGNAQDASMNPVGGNRTTDAEIQLAGGVTKRLTSRFDAVADYSYSQFYAYGGQFNPKTFSVGAIYHLGKR